MAADVLAYRAHEVPVGEDQREHIELMRDVAENFNKRFGETLVVPEGNIPTVGARVRDLQEPDEEDVDHRRHAEQGTVYVDEEPASIVKKFKSAQTDSGREIVCADDKPGISNLIEILAVVRGVTPADDRARVRRRRRLRRLQDRRGRGGRRLAGARARAATWSCARTPPRSRSSSSRGRREGARDRRSGRRRRARADGRRPPVARVRPPGLAFPRVRIAELELDLDVFAGPFDLLLSLILREELDLLEVDLAEVVVAYLDHLESADELDLESATEFLVLIAALLELKSRLMLPGEEVEELDELGPAEAAEELVERMLQYAALPRRRRAPGRAARARAGVPVPLARRRSSRPAADVDRGAYDPARARRRAGRAAAHAAADRPHAHGDRRASPSPSGSRSCATCCAAGRSRSTRRSRTPTA